MTTSARTAVAVYEAAFVLQETERTVRGRLRRGELRDVGAGRGVRIDAGELDGLLAGQPLRQQVLRGVLAGVVVVPHPARRGDPPAGLHIAIDALRTCP